MLFLHQDKEKNQFQFPAINFVKSKHNAPRDIPISLGLYFNQRSLNFSQFFASDTDYIFFVRPVYEQHYLRSSINFAIHKILPGTLTAGTVKNNVKRTIERFIASNNETE